MSKKQGVAMAKTNNRGGVAENPLPHPLEGEGIKARGEGLIFVACHDGPPEIQFSGRRWLRGVKQEMTEKEWAAMQERPDFKHFDFKLEE